jgi:GAF domain-containing protein
LSELCAAARLLTPKLRARAMTRDGRLLRLGPGQAATRALLHQEIQISHNPTESILPYLVENGGAEWSEVLQERTVVSVPLLASGEIVGGMVLLTQRRTIADRELDSLRGFAAQAATAIVNARLYEDLRTAYDDLRVAQDELVRSSPGSRRASRRSATPSP